MDKIKVFWDNFLKDTQRDLKTTYIEVFHFELTEKLAKELLDLVLAGKKKATAASLKSYEISQEPIPKPGDLSIVTDFNGNPKCVIETTKVQIIPFNEMTYEICKREGEDDSLESWKQGHKRFYEAEGKMMGYKFSEDLLVCFEDFEMIYQR
ncbi:MAG: ASCH domain-containing protein [Candidatus Izemoplasmatales bacterium]